MSLENLDDFKNEDDPKNKDDLKNDNKKEDNLKYISSILKRGSLTLAPQLLASSGHAFVNNDSYNVL